MAQHHDTLMTHLVRCSAISSCFRRSMRVRSASLCCLSCVNSRPRDCKRCRKWVGQSFLQLQPGGARCGGAFESRFSCLGSFGRVDLWVLLSVVVTGLSSLIGHAIRKTHMSKEHNLNVQSILESTTQTDSGALHVVWPTGILGSLETILTSKTVPIPHLL